MDDAQTDGRKSGGPAYVTWLKAPFAPASFRGRRQARTGTAARRLTHPGHTGQPAQDRPRRTDRRRTAHKTHGRSPGSHLTPSTWSSSWWLR